MKKYLLWIYSFTLLFAIDDSDFFPYVSPGIQIGLNGEGNFFFSIQIRHSNEYLVVTFGV